MPTVKDTYTIDGNEVEILIEVDNKIKEGSIYGETRDGAISKIASAKDMLEHGFQLARNCAAVAVIQFNQLAGELKPDEFSIEVGIKLDGNVGAALVKLGGEAHMRVNMTWKGKK